MAGLIDVAADLLDVQGTSDNQILEEEEEEEEEGEEQEEEQNRLKRTSRERPTNWRQFVSGKSTWNASGVVTLPWRKNCKQWWPATKQDGRMLPYD